MKWYRTRAASRLQDPFFCMRTEDQVLLPRSAMCSETRLADVPPPLPTQAPADDYDKGDFNCSMNMANIVEMKSTMNIYIIRALQKTYRRGVWGNLIFRLCPHQYFTSYIA